MTSPKEAKGGVFSTADIPLIKKALDKYKDYLVMLERTDSTTTATIELNQVANLMHRLNNRI